MSRCRSGAIVLALGILGTTDCAAGQATQGYLSGADGTQLYFRQVGSGPDTAVLLHGGPGLSMGVSWPDLAPLAEHAVVLLYDQRGAGRSEIITDSTRLRASDHVRDLEALRQHFGLAQMTLIGQSWGGGLAILYAAEHPERVKRILLVGPMPPTVALYALRQKKITAKDSVSGATVARLIAAIPTAGDPVPLCRQLFATYLTSYFADRASAAHLKADPCDVPPQGIRNFPFVSNATMQSLGAWDFIPLLTRLTMPVLVVDGALSVPTVDGMHVLARGLPNGRLLLIPGAGHYPQIEQPDRFFPPVAAFLHGVWPADATTEHR
jgi:proline iminopeptidase